MSLVRAVHGRKLDRVPNEEDRLLNISIFLHYACSLLTVLLKTQSRLPSSVYIFIPQPWTSRDVSAEPDSGPTVETRRRTGDFFPALLRKLADVMSEQSASASNTPYALQDGTNKFICSG